MGSFEGEGEFRCFTGVWYKGQWKRGLRHGQVNVTNGIEILDIAMVLIVEEDHHCCNIGWVVGSIFSAYSKGIILFHMDSCGLMYIIPVRESNIISRMVNWEIRSVCM